MLDQVQLVSPVGNRTEESYVIEGKDLEGVSSVEHRHCLSTNLYAAGEDRGIGFVKVFQLVVEESNRVVATSSDTYRLWDEE